MCQKTFLSVINKRIKLIAQTPSMTFSATVQKTAKQKIAKVFLFRSETECRVLTVMSHRSVKNYLALESRFESFISRCAARR